VSDDLSAIIVGAVSVLLAASLFRVSGVVERSKRAVAVATDAVRTMRSTSLSEDEQEAAIRRASIQLFGSFFYITFGLAIVLMVPAGFIWLSDIGGLASNEEVIEVLLSWPAIVITVVIFVIVSIRRKEHVPD
jgi:hypothetical protein